MPPPAAQAAASPGDQRGGGGHVPPHARQVPGGDDRIGRQAVDLRLVQQQEERARAADAVVRVVAVQPRLRHARLVQVGHPLLRPFAQLVERAELDGLGRAGLGAGRFRPSPSRS